MSGGYVDDILSPLLRERVRDKAPAWLRDVVFNLASRAERFGQEAETLRDAMEAAAVLAGESDTMLIGEDDVPPRPLPAGAEVEFHGLFAVTTKATASDGDPTRPLIKVTKLGGAAGMEITLLTEEDIVIRGRA